MCGERNIGEGRASMVKEERRECGRSVDGEGGVLMVKEERQQWSVHVVVDGASM